MALGNNSAAKSKVLLLKAYAGIPSACQMTEQELLLSQEMAIQELRLIPEESISTGLQTETGASYKTAASPALTKMEGSMMLLCLETGITSFWGQRKNSVAMPRFLNTTARTINGSKLAVGSQESEHMIDLDTQSTYPMMAASSQ